MADKNYKLTFTMSDGTSKTVSFTAPQGPKGDDGKTPVAGVDYWTESDKEAFLSEMDTVRFTEQTLTEEQKAQVRENIGVSSGGTVSNIEPSEDDIPKVFFGAALPQTKDDTVMSFRYISKTEDISGYCKTKAQGNSSMSYPKKNQTVKLYKDADCTEKLKVDFKGWGKQNKFVFKANWIDLTHARNIVSARLWGDVVKSRANYESIPELLRTSPNQGAVDGFPVKVYAGGVYQGRYTLNIPKDAWMANMDDELDAHCILCGENYVSGCFRAEAKIDESDWTDEIHDTVPTSIKTRWNEVISFVMNSTDEEFKANLATYFDVDSLIDYYIFGLLSCGLDAFGKNQLYMTYDGQKWYAQMYDMDSTWGLYWNGSKILDANYSRSSYEDFVSTGSNGDGNLLYIRLEGLFKTELKARWEELKTGILSIDNIINRFERFTDIAPAELVEEDYASTTCNGAFIEIPSQSTNNIQQIRDNILNRRQYVSSYIESLGTDPDLLYSLPSETTFDGVDDFIDTGVKLFDTAKDFTIVCDVTQGVNSKANAVWSCAEYKYTDSTYNGAKLGVYQYEPTGFSVYCVPNNGNKRGCGNISDTERVKIAVMFVGGVLNSVRYKTASGTISTANLQNTTSLAYTQHNNNLLLGAMSNDSSTAAVKLTDYWNGTIHALEVYSKALTESEIAEKLLESLPESEPEFGEGLLYSLPSETTFDGVDDYINTGVKLFDTQKDFTIVCDVTQEEQSGNSTHAVWSCSEYTDGTSASYAGARLARYPYETGGLSVYSVTGNGSSRSCGNVPNAERVKIVTVFTAGILTAVRYKTESGASIESKGLMNTDKLTYVSIDSNLSLGMALSMNGANWDFWKGTIHSLEVYDHALTDAEISEVLMA